MKKTRSIIKTNFKDFINEDKALEKDDTYIKTIEFDGENLTLHVVKDNPMKVQFYLNTIEGEPYIDLNTIIEENMLKDAVWIKKGGEEEKIADMLDILLKTDKTTKSGFNTYFLYDIVY